MSKLNPFGEVTCSGEHITHSLRGRSWRLAVHAIKLVAEFSVPAGPLVLDFYFVFMTAPVNGWHQVSFYARGREAMLAFLGEKFAGAIESDAADPLSEPGSRILWPAHLRGGRLWETPPKQIRPDEGMDNHEAPQGLQLSPAAKFAFKA